MTGESFEQEAAHANVDMGLGLSDALLLVTGAAAGLVEPSGGALRGPALSHQLEAFGIITVAHDVHVQFAEGTQAFDARDHQPVGLGR